MAKAAKKQKTENMQFSAEISKVLKLVIHSLYTNKDIFLRELISNASDACEKLRYLALTNTSLAKENPDLKIQITVDEKARTITVTDNGIGMNYEELVQNLGTIAKSGTEHFLKEAALDGASKDASLIGQFGVGFYSAFMVADKVTVLTRKAGEEVGYLWESEGEGEYRISPAKDELVRGTSITLHVRKGMDVYLDKFRLQHIISTYSDHIAFPIELKDIESGTSEVVNEGSALWNRPKSEITEEQYREFYHHVAHSGDTPWMTIHNKVEGKLSYTNLLFIPSVRPFDLFHPDRRRRVKLYVKRVFITDENVDLVPQYLRFLRGVIDSEDLPLNISRETLQDNPMLANIRESITKKVLSELKKKAEKDSVGYEKFWINFGAALKEGLCEASSNKEPLLEVCRFYSTKVGTEEGKRHTSLDEYLSRMKEGQEHIFFLTGERLEAMQQSPQLEGFKKAGIEVLLLNEHVDDFWVTVAGKFKGKGFKSVLNADKDLDKLLEESQEAKKDEDKSEEKSPDMNGLITALKMLFGEEVEDVRTTHKLEESPVCLAIQDGRMSMRMERFLVEHKQLGSTSARILEINPIHPVIKHLAAQVTKEGMDTESADIARLLLDQARILEGEELRDPGAFSRRMNLLLAKRWAG